ncbi:uncharacterized protein MELLADRAFT_70378 [Melampsora larici-populina 98AG31]|uniref:J domain-containing protein n=1 Tax=Melampsora larici-populina (strain 98AG31 / pathotype 3-4-7) TaxID=747676 RepID=F4R350_MELLP|nr:uncharacterized protein MELLADRAFT_70378 [Melampsora larici-populina 98AG31]EGG13231.1 hypothetical protein MELLADRAFT_70378 [Melampsora larici-populina 98AG31]
MMTRKTYCQSLYIISSSSSSSTPTPSRTKFSTSSTTRNPTNFPFPNHPYPTPYEIFHLPKTANTIEIKSRYYQLVKIHHPDLGFSITHLPSSSTTNPSKAHQTGSQSIGSEDRFKKIVEAYELLKSPSRRQVYLNSGEGWPRSSNSSSRASRAPPSSSSSDRPYRPFYPSSLWDWTSSNPRNETNRYTTSTDDDDHWFSSRYHQSSSTFKEQWERDGLFTKNGIFISSLGCVGVMFYCFQAWKVMPLLDHNKKYQDSNGSSNFNSHRSEPIGDKRLDWEAWHQSNPTASQPTPQPSIHTSSLSPEHHGSYPHPLAPTSYMDVINRRSQNAAKDLKAARAAAISPSHLAGGKSITPDLVSSHTRS